MVVHRNLVVSLPLRIILHATWFISPGPQDGLQFSRPLVGNLRRNWVAVGRKASPMLPAVLDCNEVMGLADHPIGPIFPLTSKEAIAAQTRPR